jgi:hypothetical protein
MSSPQRGDFGVISYNSTGGRLITLGERLMNALGDKGKPQYDHAFVVVEVIPESNAVKVIEAKPSGADFGHYAIDDPRIAWSHRNLSDWQRDLMVNTARKCLGIPYSWLDYWAIAAHSLHLPIPGLKDYIESTGHMICSQLVDFCAESAQDFLFNDNRWCGYVTPSELGEFCS